MIVLKITKWKITEMDHPLGSRLMIHYCSENYNLFSSIMLRQNCHLLYLQNLIQQTAVKFAEHINGLKEKINTIDCNDFHFLIPQLLRIVGCND